MGGGRKKEGAHAIHPPRPAQRLNLPDSRGGACSRCARHQGAGAACGSHLPRPGAGPALAPEFYGTGSTFPARTCFIGFWVAGGTATVPARDPTVEGCHGWSFGESRAVSVWGSSALPGLWLRCLLPHGLSRLATSVPARACQPHFYPAGATLPACPVWSCFSLPAQPAFPGTAALSLCTWCSSSPAGSSRTFVGGLYSLAGYIPFVCTTEERSCFLWEMGEERRVNRTNPVSSPLSQTWKQLPRHPPSPTCMAGPI